MKINELVKYAMEHQVNYFDAVFLYPGSEHVIAETLKEYDRESPSITARNTWTIAN